ncbi:lethal, checkpoint-defective, DNA damage sensitive protein [Scheffersomyces spartinae]|uniref:Lethal, checkpoint-defective, DNA damage sensitive protein n=1 Tax=Scheffersomyces spartinae TaxID=45513 RepID=A0A9P7VAZ3_9ASCO|nr:lethal, checkpoint-defective, DNA damage sensitive protein [Scheffersomyces spartinae]KAG7194726.1 lethal, checkpoint-defective, DNA damage sensitive protein [Scheffersomyces spartinae]
MSSPTDDNDDDSFFEALTKAEFGLVPVLQPTQQTTSIAPIEGVSLNASQSIKNDIYRADGEIKILRAQLDEVRSKKDIEIARLREQVDSLKHDHSNLVAGLRGMVDKLEDEKKFLNNELKSLFLTSKRRKVVDTQGNDNVYSSKPIGGESLMIVGSMASPASLSSSSPSSSAATTFSGAMFSLKRHKKSNDQTWLFIDEITASSINGCQRTNLELLLKIYIESSFISEIDTFEVTPKSPLSSTIIKYLMNNKEIRLDVLVEDFCHNLMKLISHLIANHNHTASLPFLLSLVHTCIGFRPNAVSSELILWLTERLIATLVGQMNLLEEGEDIQIGYFDIPDQQLMFKKLYIICAMDTMEKLTVLASSKNFSIWHLIPTDLFRQCLPDNTNTFVGVAQINLVYNVVVMLQSSAGPDSFAYQSSSTKNDQSSTEPITTEAGVSSKEVINSLLKTFLMDIGIKQEFAFYGLNRLLGNNCDLSYIEQAIPTTTNILGQSMVANPDPIRREKWQVTPLMKLKHEEHLLNLRLLISNLLEYYVTVNPAMFMNGLNYEEVIKAIIRVMGYEQNNIMTCPRDRYIHLRLKIIASLIVILYHMVFHKRSNDIIYPETMYEIFVVLTRISFSNESLMVKATEFLERVRKLLVTIPIFNQWCEQHARELNHIDVSSPIAMKKSTTTLNINGDAKKTASVESEYANGIEFPYETETVELARDVLNSFVDTVEADNLYYNMNCEEEGRDIPMDIDELVQETY